MGFGDVYKRQFPIVGIPMVMFSYGGSSLLCATIALAVISLIIGDHQNYETLGVKMYANLKDKIRVRTYSRDFIKDLILSS